VLLADRLSHAIAQAQRNRAIVAICYLDLDGFKQINDTQGHQAGDVALKIVAARMTEVLRASDTAARVGGDEFVVLMSELDSIASVKPLLERLLHAIDQPMDINGQSTRVSASMGVSLYPINSEVPDTLLRQADMAMYHAKVEGKNCYRISGQKAPSTL
jgi:diguanylate cyclase (GGDEF)-like protein